MPYLKEKLVSFSALTLLVWLYVPEMTYNVLRGMLSLYTTTAPQRLEYQGDQLVLESASHPNQ